MFDIEALNPRCPSKLYMAILEAFMNNEKVSYDEATGEVVIKRTMEERRAEAARVRERLFGKEES